jgi:hypothetical protein
MTTILFYPETKLYEVSVGQPQGGTYKIRQMLDKAASCLLY